ncbi:MAG TPA: SGNH/GDSL hydrolase family protein [Rugosimonospora sp.]|nr:SGNH/GDSL hydrolase family protein [Rugosimonospora sp.]
MRPVRFRKRRLAGMAVTAAVVLTGVAVSGVPNALAATRSTRFAGTYVALGDSYTAGPGIANQRKNAGSCARSDHNYPTLVAQSIKPTGFTDVSCSGALTTAMTTSFLNQPPQFNALNARTRLVTVGIGGNDAGFAPDTVTCGLLFFTNPNGAPCKAHFTQGGKDQLDTAIQQVGPKVAAVLKGIHQRAPKARVLLIGYPDLLPNSKAKCNANIQVPISTGDFPYLESKIRELNSVLRTRAAQNHATYVDTFTSSVGHDLCQAPGTRWIEGILNVQNAIPVHPNALGMRNDARQILAALRRR